ncbi:hypothetical protein QWY74_01720 [Halomonas almeriensis]|uniref:hypothetical protein n=1 Tax=Halomonas almeriensis TaxID=308163 RepID=UPI0025B2CA58|nr:hypothetical protein [Halomonas almeriensis]MDN3552196.1 hypothetical protein [Halomonas almeriensis]
MNDYEIVVELDDVGHVTKAISPDGEVLATAAGFGARDAKRRLKAELTGNVKTKNVLVKSAKRKTKIHNAAGVIFAAKNRIEGAKEKRVGSKKKRGTKGK